MEWNTPFLTQCFLNTLSPHPAPRRAAEASLAKEAEEPNYGLKVLRLLSEPAIDEQIRQAAAVSFKNHLKARWHPASSRSDRNLPTANPIPDSEKDQIKSLMVPLMLSTTPKIQSQLSEALVVIGKHDFPKSWPSLLPELVAMLHKEVEAGDFSKINGILGTVNSLCKKFRYMYGNNDVRIDLKYCLDNFAAPLLQVFARVSGLIDTAVGSNSPASVLKPLFECQRLCCRISYSFNFQELPEYFEDHMEDWMVLFRRFLITSYPTLELGSAGDPGVVDSLRAAICDILSLYMDRNEEPFEMYVDAFGRDVRDLLVNASANIGREQLAITAMKFLTTLSMRSPQNFLFSDDASLDQICRSIVVPNVMIREEEEELFEMNYVEFIRRDMEGSDLDTRRRIACELLKAIAANYRERVIQLSLGLIQDMLSTPNWKCKDCAIYLILSLATNRAGGASVPTGFIDVGEFFTNVIVPELRSQDVNGTPFLKADALKFFTVFRSLLPKQTALELIPDVVRFLGSEANVVHSYSAICIEKLLLVKDGGVARYQANDVAPFFAVLMTNLFNALKFPESEENQYIMKCIMRVLGVADISRDVAGICIAGLTSILNEVCKNPKSPTFNHYLFEAVAVLIKRSCINSPDLVSAFEGSLLPCLQNILVNNVIEFFPYAFQLLAQLVELNKPPLPLHYAQFFEILLTPDLWKKSSDVPALVRLLQAFLRMSSSEPSIRERLSQVLGIFRQLISSPSTEEQGFFVLNTIIENLTYDVIAEYMGHIWFALFQRLEPQKRTAKFVRCFVILLSLFLIKHGWKNLVDSMNSLQPNVFNNILEQVWIPNLRQITGALEVKLTAVASTKLICECHDLMKPEAANRWGKMLDSIVTLLSRPEQERIDDETEVPDFVEASGYTASFVRLYNAGKKDEDPVKDIQDPKIFLLSSLASLPGFSSGVFQNVIIENLEPANQTVLLQGFSG